MKDKMEIMDVKICMDEAELSHNTNTKLQQVVKMYCKSQNEFRSTNLILRSSIVLVLVVMVTKWKGGTVTFFAEICRFIL